MGNAPERARRRSAARPRIPVGPNLALGSDTERNRQRIKRLESNEDADTEMYASLAEIAPTEADRTAVNSVKQDEETHSGAFQKTSQSTNAQDGPQAMLDIILHRESWHRRGGGWIGQAIYGANDGLGSVFGIVTGVAGATAGGPAVLIAGLAGMLASALSMGSGAYLATKTEREVQEAELRRESRELQIHPEEEEEELSLFYQLKGVPEDEAKMLASRLIAQPESALKTLGSEELGLSEQSFPNPWTEALSAMLSTALGAFIPIIPFFFPSGYGAILASFIISTLAHFSIGVGQNDCNRLESLEERRGNDHYRTGGGTDYLWIRFRFRKCHKVNARFALWQSLELPILKVQANFPLFLAVESHPLDPT